MVFITRTYARIQDMGANKKDAVYQILLESRGEEYANLYLASEEERLSYIAWWQENFDTENDKIKDLELESED